MGVVRAFRMAFSSLWSSSAEIQASSITKQNSLSINDSSASCMEDTQRTLVLGQVRLSFTIRAASRSALIIIMFFFTVSSFRTLGYNAKQKSRQTVRSQLTSSSALRLCVWLFYNGCFQFDYADKCLLFTLWTKQREVLKHRITAYPRSCLVSANRAQYPFITQSWSPHYSLWWDKLSQSTVVLTGN